MLVLFYLSEIRRILGCSWHNHQLLAKCFTFLNHQADTKKQHLIPCHSEFKKIMDRMPYYMDSPYFFVNPHGRLDGKHYQHDCLVDLWKKACQEVGEDIPMYAGLKHSSCSQYVNEKGYSLDEVQMLTDHARRDSVKRYAAFELEAKRKLLEGK